MDAEANERMDVFALPSALRPAPRPLRRVWWLFCPPIVSTAAAASPNPAPAAAVPAPAPQVTCEFCKVDVDFSKEDVFPTEAAEPPAAAE